jgi:hypothetical protein
MPLAHWQLLEQAEQLATFPNTAPAQLPLQS